MVIADFLRSYGNITSSRSWGQRLVGSPPPRRRRRLWINCDYQTLPSDAGSSGPSTSRRRRLAAVRCGTRGAR